MLPSLADDVELRTRPVRAYPATNGVAGGCEISRGTQTSRWRAQRECSIVSGRGARPASDSKGLHHGVVEAVADRAHRRQEPRVDGSTSECPRSELSALVAV